MSQPSLNRAMSSIDLVKISAPLHLILACAALSAAATGSIIPVIRGGVPVPVPTASHAARSNVAGDVLLPDHFAAVQADRRKAQQNARR
ncbi:hypothetical protein F5X99DRAFT_408023 [Biscogniauxia marginata]|nr:hypothetical protein F5X99DRAFT_408023 [Biscogniauxia marginata]